MNRNRSVATIDKPEFINIQPYNPNISKCEIKVLYTGKNRNGSFITKDVAIQMANSLPCTPIVGVFREDIKDFGDHGHIMHLENGEITFACNTKPYGFVAPDAEVWFQKFNDYDEFGNVVEREYLMTTGYLWTSQYEEAMSCINGGKGQSMELDSETIDGHWATDNNSGVDFFIINDAYFTKLCILGDDVEPCFEGASIKAPEISSNFSKDSSFGTTLYSMMNELKYALQNKGGSDMPNEFEETEVSEKPVLAFEDASDGGDADAADDSVETETEEGTEEGAEEAPETEPTVPEETEDEESNESQEEEKSEEESGDDAPISEEAEKLIDTDVNEPRKKLQDFAKNEEEENEDEEEESSEDDSADDSDEDKEKKPSAEHSLEEVEAEFAALKAEYEKLSQEYSAVVEELKSLHSFKLEIENQQKDEIINKYYMLDDSDKADVIEHKAEYTCEEIESKLALIYVKKNVDFSAMTEEAPEVEEKEPTSTFSLDTAVDLSTMDPILKALRAAREN